MRKQLRTYDVGTCEAKFLPRALLGLLSLGWMCIGFSIQPALADDESLEAGQDAVDGRVIERIRINPSLVYEVNIADVAETAAFEPDFAFEPLDVPDPAVVGNVRRGIASNLDEFEAGIDRTIFGAGSNPSQLPASSFQALFDNNTRFPPDTHGAVGLDHIMTVLNTQIRIQDRVGSAQALLVAVGNISKLLWPSNPRLAKRGNQLRTSLSIRGGSVLAPRNFRNHIEHFDERLEEWATSSQRRNFVDSNVGPPGMIAGVDKKDFLRNFDTERFAITFRGDTYALRPVVEAVQQLRDAAAKVTPVASREWRG